MVIKKLIIFTDRGDILRAPVAREITRQELTKRGLQDRYYVISARTQGWAPDDPEPQKFQNITYYPERYSECKPWLEQHGIDLSKYWSTAIISWCAEKADIIFAMDKKTKKSLLLMYPECEDKIRLFSEIGDKDVEIEDPELMKGEQLEHTLTGIKNIIIEGLPRLLSLTDRMYAPEVEISVPMFVEKEQNRARRK